MVRPLANRPTLELMKSRLISIDALRGFAALWVVFYHFRLPHPTHGDVYWLWWQFCHAGILGVYLFFAISGYCIHLKVACGIAEGGKGTVDFWPFWKRRAKRLYPPYLAALALYMAITALQGHFRLEWYDLSVHLAMVHNVDARTVYSLNGVFWTLAIEEQLYLLYFPLLALRQRYGWAAALSVTLMARVGWQVFSHLVRYRGWDLPIGESAAWNWCAWALGAMAVEAHFGLLPRLSPWPPTRALLAGGVAVIAYQAANSPGASGLGAALIGWAASLGLALVFAVLLYAVTANEKSGSGVSSPVRALAWVGSWSYSLYLVHECVQSYGAPLLAGSFGLHGRATQLLVLTPLALLTSYLFHRAIERPCM